RRRKAWIVFQDESGFSLLPSVRATWAPRGQTPVLRHHFSWTRLSMSAALAFRPDGTCAFRRSRTTIPVQSEHGSGRNRTDADWQHLWSLFGCQVAQLGGQAT